MDSGVLPLRSSATNNFCRAAFTCSVFSCPAIESLRLDLGAVAVSARRRAVPAQLMLSASAIVSRRQGGGLLMGDPRTSGAGSSGTMCFIDVGSDAMRMLCTDDRLGERLRSDWVMRYICVRRGARRGWGCSCSCRIAVPDHQTYQAHQQHSHQAHQHTHGHRKGVKHDPLCAARLLAQPCKHAHVVQFNCSKCASAGGGLHLQGSC